MEHADTDFVVEGRRKMEVQGLGDGSGLGGDPGLPPSPLIKVALWTPIKTVLSVSGLKGPLFGEPTFFHY